MPGTPVTFQQRLTVRLMLFLSLALIPVGLLAVLQTREVVKRIDAQTETRLADETESAARSERENILWALGAATGLGELYRTIGDDPAMCDNAFRNFAEQEPNVRAAGVITITGEISCSSAGERLNVSDWDGLSDMRENPRAFVNYSENPPISKMPVLISLVPLLDANNDLNAIIFLSQPHRNITLEEGHEVDAVFKTFNRDGEILTSSDGDKDGKALLPEGRDLATLATDTGMTFASRSHNGQEKIYSVSPIIDGTVYAVGIWSPGASQLGLLGIAMSIPVFPVLMWMASLLVAYVAVDRLVLRHIRRLRFDMRRFARSRTMPAGRTADMPAEIGEIFDTFQTASETILRDEAELERLLHDKNVLLKEVHHRVKNNLQLISSIMNMQMRKLKSPEASGALRRLQARVLSLATVHRTLYKTESLGSVKAGPLLKELVTQMTDIAIASPKITVDTHFDPLTLYPDQAVPVSLLTAEAVTNALKYAGNQRGETAWLRVRLISEESGHACLSVENSTGPIPAMSDDAVGSSGLGTNLIRAFAAQLGTSAEIEEADGVYRLACRFEVLEFQVEDNSNRQPAEEEEEDEDDSTFDAA